MISVFYPEILMSKSVNKEQSWKKWSKVKVAAGQVNIDSDALSTMVNYIDQAGKDGAQIIALPEYILGPFQLPFVKTDPIGQIANAAARNNIYVIVGGWEEYEKGAYESRKKDAFANTAVLFDRNGQLLGKYNKNHRAIGPNPHCWPPKGDEHEWLMKDGDGFPVFDLDFGRIGIMTCYDGYFAESALSLSLKGAEIIFWINGRPSRIEKYIVQADMHRAYCAMVTINQGNDGFGAMIATYQDQILKHVDETGNHYISAEIDLDVIRCRRLYSRTFHQRRPEIYDTIVQEHKPWEIYE
jgi:predicted amidohydrolase